MVLEAVLNGARGITYYCFQDFDTPEDFYYHAKALVKLAPYQKLLKEGAPHSIQGSNPGLFYSAFQNQGKMLLLVGNYQGQANGVTTVALPFEEVQSVKDVSTGKEMPPGISLSLDVKSREFVLLEINGKPSEALPAGEQPSHASK